MYSKDTSGRRGGVMGNQGLMNQQISNLAYYETASTTDEFRMSVSVSETTSYSRLCSSLKAMFMAWRTASSVGTSLRRASSALSASVSLPSRSSASAISALQHWKSGCFFSTFSASWSAFLLFPLSSQSARWANLPLD